MLQSHGLCFLIPSIKYFHCCLCHAFFLSFFLSKSTPDIQYSFCWMSSLRGFFFFSNLLPSFSVKKQFLVHFLSVLWINMVLGSFVLYYLYHDKWNFTLRMQKTEDSASQVNYLLGHCYLCFFFLLHGLWSHVNYLLLYKKYRNFIWYK